MSAWCAGDGEDVGRHDTLAAGSDSMSDAVGTSGSLMHPALHQPQPGVHLLPSHAQPRAPSPSRPLKKLQTELAAEPQSAVSPKSGSPKRKTIALTSGALIPHPRKRRRQAVKGDEQQQPAEQRVHPSEPQQQQQQQQQEGSSQAYLAKFGIPESNATVVDFLELQLARITRSDDEPGGADLIQSVAQDICSAWQLFHCPLTCIMAAFVSAFLECAAPPPSFGLPAGVRSQPGQDPEIADPTQSSPEPEPTDFSGTVEDTPLARLWCSSSARKQHSLTWLGHCADHLDKLLSAPPQPQTALKAQPPTPTPKRRGRPPGRKNNKTLLRLQQAGLSLPEPQQQPEVAGTASDGQPKAVVPLKEGAFLLELHGQVLHYLGQVCQKKVPGPFETEICCLSATAAFLGRIAGKVQVHPHACPLSASALHHVNRIFSVTWDSMMIWHHN